MVVLEKNRIDKASCDGPLPFFTNCPLHYIGTAARSMLRALQNPLHPVYHIAPFVTRSFSQG